MSGMIAAATVGAAAISGGAQYLAADKAADAQKDASGRADARIREATEQARTDVNRLFPQAQERGRQGYQQALDVFGQSLPAQMDTFQQGNIGAQQAILSGLPQIQNALMGGNVDYSGFQPYQTQMPDTGFFNQQLPSTVANQNHQSEMDRIQQGAMLGSEIINGIRQGQYDQATGMGNRILELSGIPQAGSAASGLWDKGRTSPSLIELNRAAILKQGRRGSR